MTHIKFFRTPLLIVFLFVLTFSHANAQGIPERPNPPRLVNDFANILSPQEVTDLENRLVIFNDSTSTQIVVVIVPSLNDLEKADFAEQLGSKWGVGQQKTNNGCVVLIKPKTAGENGEAFIAPGYGLESVIPDATAFNIVNNEMIPHFKQNDYYSGINAGVETVMALTRGEFTAAQYDKRNAKKTGAGFLIPIIILIIVFLMIKGGGGRHHSIGKSLPFWTMMMLMGSGNRGGGGFGSGGGGGFGGGGGGGFGGFGGGGFGGGGAGGSW
jgi:Beta-propeller domains of methanol dehydrogenase type